MAIRGLHAIMYSTKADETRQFLKNVLNFQFVDAGHGWLIFKAPPAEIAVHPADNDSRHELFLMCDDLHATVRDLHAKGVTTAPVAQMPWGLATSLTLPSGEQLGLYVPSHPKAIDLR